MILKGLPSTITKKLFILKGLGVFWGSLWGCPWDLEGDLISEISKEARATANSTATGLTAETGRARNCTGVFASQANGTNRTGRMPVLLVAFGFLGAAEFGGYSCFQGGVEA
jgi:hypothetical protein